MFFKCTEKGVGSIYLSDDVRVCFVKHYLTKLWHGTVLAIKGAGEYEAIDNGDMQLSYELETGEGRRCLK